jgi:hypothetical protein
MSLVAFKPDMQYAFLFSNFVWSTYGSPWLQLSAQGKLGVLSQQACSAFSQVTFGRHHARHDLEIEGTERYGKAVSKVRASLGDTSNPAFPELLVSVLIFLLYSSSAAGQQEAQSHVMGLFTLLRIAGPQSFRLPTLRNAFSSCRATLVTVGLLQKTRLFLEDESWKNEPWSLDPSSKSNQDRLVDILVHVPGFLQDQKTAQFDCHSSLRQLLVRQVLRQLNLLFRWRWTWDSDHSNVATEEARAQYETEAALYPAEAKNLLEFSSFTMAVEISLYNAVLLCLLGLLYSELTVEQAQREIDKVAVEAQVPRNCYAAAALTVPLPGLISMRAAAVEVVRSFEYQLAHVGRDEGTRTLFWLFPLGLASKVLRRDLGATLWIQEMLDTSEITRGYGRGNNAFGFGFYELPDVNERDGDPHRLV